MIQSLFTALRATTPHTRVVSTITPQALSIHHNAKRHHHHHHHHHRFMHPAGVLAALLTSASIAAASLTPSECAAAPSPPPPTPLSTTEKAALAAAMGKLHSQFACPLLVLNNLARQMNDEMLKGLLATQGSQIKMLPSYVSHLPTGQESGEFLALDLGGSNFRVVTFRLEANQGVTLVEARKVTIPAALMTATSSAHDLFGFIADQVGLAPGAKDLSTPELNLGFTFSFPVDQKSIDSGILLHWTKGFATQGCVGEEIVGLLQKELLARGISVKVSALVNDTVGTLVANTIDDADTHVGVILGTGCNACYTEKTTNIVKMKNTSGQHDEEMVRPLFCCCGCEAPSAHSAHSAHSPRFLVWLHCFFLFLFLFFRSSTWNGVDLIPTRWREQRQCLITPLIGKKIRPRNDLKNKSPVDIWVKLPAKSASI